MKTVLVIGGAAVGVWALYRIVSALAAGVSVPSALLNPTRSLVALPASDPAKFFAANPRYAQTRFGVGHFA